MRHTIVTIFSLVCTLFISSALIAQDDAAVEPVYYDKEHFLIEGTAVEESEKECAYDRLPATYKELVREPVWKLSKNSAGISIRFWTNSTSISARWTVLEDMTMSHMAPSGIKGLDLYVRHDDKWRYVATGRPTRPIESTDQSESMIYEAMLVGKMQNQRREFKVFLPLYDGVTNLEIGIDEDSDMEKAKASSKKPIVFYGTSITQGGCASRPGMAHTNIISREVDTEVINFGFSGNGRMEKAIVDLIADIDASFYVIECLQNMSVEQIRERTAPLVEAIRKKHPLVPIVLGNNMIYEAAFLDQDLLDDLNLENEVLREEYEKLVAKGDENIFYIDNSAALGNDHEATVDGVHLTDLGFMRMANHLIDNFRHFGILE